MPPGIRVLSRAAIDVPAEEIRVLHSSLAVVGLPVGDAEVSATPTFGEDTEARVRDFQTRYRLPVNGVVDAVTGGVLSLATLVTSQADRATVRAQLRDAATTAPDSAEYKYWLARYALVAGDYALAARVSPALTDLTGADLSGGIFETDVGTGVPRAPEVAFPENYYSYRYDLIPQVHIDALRAGRPQSLGTAHGFMARAFNDPDLPPGRPDRFESFPEDPPSPDRPKRLADSAEAWLDAIEAWQVGNADFAKQRYAGAVAAYDRCQRAALKYFSTFPDYDFRFTGTDVSARVDELVARIATDRPAWVDTWREIDWRRQLLSLAELGELDWVQIGPYSSVYLLLQGNLAGQPQPLPPTNALQPQHRKMLMDARLLVIAAVLVPLARGEANRLRRQYAAAKEDFSRVLRNEVEVPGTSPPQNVPAFLKCEFIEAPFARLLLMETLLDEAEAEYKARASVPAESVVKLGELAQSFSDRQIPGDAANAAKPFQHLAAALSYASVFDVMREDGEYVARAKQALDGVQALLASTAASDVTSMAFRSIGKTVTLPTVSATGSTLPGLTTGTHPHESFVEFDTEVMRERNPRVYALLLQAQARLLQIWSGFNYLGYRDDYLPPWRFQYLLERGRYFSGHAKNAQRDYVNFLNNAENEELKEMSTAQNVELEKQNVRVESARVDQATSELAEVTEGSRLATLHAQNAADALNEYKDFEAKAEEADAKSQIASVLDSLATFAGGLASGNPGGIIGGAVGAFNSVFAGSARADAAMAQRDLEKHNLERAAAEAVIAASQARKKTDVARAGLRVAALQRQAALLRHEYALQNLQFMRDRVLNTEQWFRLAGSIRSVGDTYLRYAIETSFLAQQAYNFESDRRLQIIRFDYDLSDVGAMLAADFLLQDLDTLEQDLIVSQRTRQQQVRYVLSLAREFPESLRTLADEGSVSFSLRLEQLERHFPGLVNLRISSVELQPIALMNPTRVTVELTNLGSGMLRLKGQPGDSPLDTSDLAPNQDWLPIAGSDWPVKVRVSGPDTQVFTGLTRNEAASLSAIAANQRGAFEGLPAASSWKIDMSMAENQVVPGTLADVVITLTLSGYYDSELRQAVNDASPRSLATTSVVSARRALPDAYYSVVHDGKLVWDVSERMLSLTGMPGKLRNLAVFLPLSPQGVELGRCSCRYPVEIEVASTGAVKVLTELPKLTLTSSALTLDCRFTGAAGATVTWDFGDGTPLVEGATAQHAYRESGRYEVRVRLVRDARLFEYRSAIVVSENHAVAPPLIATPTFSATPAAGGAIDVTLALAEPGMTDVSVDWSVGTRVARAASGPSTLRLPPGRHVVELAATRKLAARFHGKQRFVPGTPVDLIRLRATTNRTFDLNGSETTSSPNPFAAHVFGGATISPVDRWTLELPLAENPWFRSVSSSDVEEFDGSEIDDAVLTLEFA